jgi:Xaa-Pro dipeptidase
VDEAIEIKLRAAAESNGWDAIVLLSPENFAYATGFVVPSHPLMRWRHAACVIPVSGEPALVVVDMETRTVRDHLPSATVSGYNEFTQHPMDVLAETIEGMSLESGHIGIELGYLPADDSARLSSRLRAQMTSCDAAIADVRVIKSPTEVDRLRALSRLTDETILAALRSVRAGMSEMDIAAKLTQGIFERGADTFKLMIVASGERSGYPNVGPTERILDEGDLVRVEIFGVRDGYHAGVCRTAVVGRPTTEQESVWSVLIECRDEILEQVRPGASSAQIYRSFLGRFERANLPAISFVGHGIGVFLHEAPYIGKYGDPTLLPGMVLGIEPLVYAPGQGMQNKDMILVTDDGCELLSDATPADRLIEIAA